MNNPHPSHPMGDGEAAPPLEEEIPAGLFTLMGPAAYFLKYNSSMFQVT